MDRSVSSTHPDRERQVIQPLGLERVEDLRHQPAAGEPAGVRPVVDARHDQAEQRPSSARTAGLRAWPCCCPSAGRTARWRRAGRRSGAEAPTVKPAPPRIGMPPKNSHATRTGGESRDPGHGVDDDHAAGAVELGARRPELPHPHHVEQDVQHAAVQPAGAEDRPPPAVLEYRHAAARAEQEQARRARRQEREDAVHPDAAARQSSIATYRPDDPHMISGTNPRSLPRRRSSGAESPEARVPPPAVVAGLVVHAHQAARTTCTPPTARLSSEHEPSPLGLHFFRAPPARGVDCRYRPGTRR